MQLLRFNPADLEGEEPAAVLSRFPIGRGGGCWTRGGWVGGGSLRHLGLKLDGVYLVQVVVGGQLGGAVTEVALADWVLATAHSLLITGNVVPLGSLLRTVNMYSHMLSTHTQNRITR